MAFVDLLNWDLLFHGSWLHSMNEVVLATASNEETSKACKALPILGAGLVSLKALAAGPALSAAEITTGLAGLGGGVAALLSTLTFGALAVNPMTAGLLAVGGLGSFGALQLTSWFCN